jgi:hypothetical protein
MAAARERVVWSGTPPLPQLLHHQVDFDVSGSNHYRIRLKVGDRPKVAARLLDKANLAKYLVNREALGAAAAMKARGFDAQAIDAAAASDRESVASLTEIQAGPNSSGESPWIFLRPGSYALVLDSPDLDAAPLLPLADQPLSRAMCELASCKFP